MKPRCAAPPLVLGLLLAALAAPSGAGAELWRWIDANGVARYTPDPDRVPAARRSTLERVEPGMPPAPPPEPAIAKPLPIFAPPGDPALEEDPWNAPGRAPAVEGETLRDSRPVEGETLRDSRPVEGEILRDSRPVEGEILRDSRPVEGEILRDSREVVVEVPTTPPPSAPPSPPAPTQSAPLAPPAPTEAGPTALATATPPTRAPGASPPAPARPLSPDAEARRAELVAAIARDEEALKEHVSSGQDASIVTNPQLREIAERLPALQAELRALDAQSAAP
jgi:hypothetical protein